MMYGAPVNNSGIDPLQDPTRMQQVIAISNSQNIPTYLAADRLAEERIAQARAIKRIGGYGQGLAVTV